MKMKGCHSEPEHSGGEESLQTTCVMRDSSAYSLRMTVPPPGDQSPGYTVAPPDGGLKPASAGVVLKPGQFMVGRRCRHQQCWGVPMLYVSI
jgi:hypothetical protein